MCLLLNASESVMVRIVAAEGICHKIMYPFFLYWRGVMPVYRLKKTDIADTDEKCIRSDISDSEAEVESK